MKIKTIISLVVSAAMLGVSGSIIPAGATDTTITVEGESVTPTTFTTDSNSVYSGGSALKLATTTDPSAGGYTVSYTVTTTQEGLYSMEIDSSNQGKKYKGDVGDGYKSPYYISINGSDNIEFDDSSEYNIGYVDANNAKYKIEAYLVSGANTVKFTIRDKRVAGDGYYRFTLDCMKFTYESSGNAYRQIKAEGENCTDSNGMATAAYDTCSNGSEVELITYNNTTIPDGGYYWKFPVYAEKAGMYALEIGAARPGAAAGDTTDEGTASWISPWTFDVNGGEGVRFYGNSQCVNNIDGRASLDAKYNTSVYLDQGENTVTFHVNSGTTGSGIAVFTLDYFTLNLMQPALSNVTMVEAEKYTQSTVKTTSETGIVYSDKRIWAQSGTDNVTLKYDMYVPQTDDYELYIMGNQLGVGWVSDYSMSVNGGTATAIGTATTKEINDMNKLAGGGLVREFKLNSTVHLNKGHNSISLTTTSKSSNNYLMVLDYLKFVKGSTKISASSDGYTATTFGLSYLNESYGYSNLYVWGADNDTTLVTADYSFLVDYAGSYDITLDLGSSLTTGYLSPAGIAVDGGSTIALTSDNCTYVSAVGLLSTSENGRYKYNVPLTLTAGMHTLRFTTLGVATLQNPQKTISRFFGFGLTKSSTLDHGTAYLSEPVMDVGDKTSVKTALYDSDGTIYNGTSQITYGSSDETVATVDGNGTVTALKSGDATIYACVATTAKDINIPVSLTVASAADTVKVSSASLANGSVTVNVTSLGAQTPSSVSVIAADYAAGLMKSADTQSVSGITNGNISKKSFTLSKYTSGDTVKVYVWAPDTLMPLVKSVTVTE